MRKDPVIQYAFFVMILISLMNFSCSGPGARVDKKNLIPEKDLVSLLTDVHIATGLLGIPSIDARFSTFDSTDTYNQVIEKHGYSKVTMDKTLKYYFLHNPKKLNKIYDQVLGILSDMETRASKDYLVEQARLSNFWRAKDFYAEPSFTKNDTLSFDIELTRPGVYNLIYTCTLFPDDQSINARAVAYSISADSIENGSPKFIRSPNYLKDGRPHTYSLSFSVRYDTKHFLRGWFFDCVYSPETKNHFKIENISLSNNPLNY